MAPEQEPLARQWTNSFFFPKVRAALGLSQGTGQQLYTADKPYNNIYTWHISVAFAEAGGGPQRVKIARLHLSFKNRGAGADKSVWFTVNNLNLALQDGNHGNYPTATEIGFAKDKVKAWAGDYTRFRVGW